MGRVKELLPEDWAPDYGPEPDDLEMLQMDAERARERYLEALNKHKANEGQRHEPV